ncbi:MAG: cyclic nucleotide-binding domain-containing protein [Nitrospira sp.]|nr:cyclic nucleotide-binding domain-containing protein [Nitrospira sp.]
MKKLLDRLAGSRQENPETPDSGYFSTMFLEREEATPPLVPWPLRASQLQATVVAPVDGAMKFARAWNNDRHAVTLAEGELKRLIGYLGFFSLAPDREVIAQDEQGDYLLIVLEGTIAVDRVQPWGGRARLGEARVGDLLGEMSLLDAGTRFSSCRTLTPCVVAVLEAGALDRMMHDDPRLAAVLLAALARRLSLRLRQASARLSALLTSGS